MAEETEPIRLVHVTTVPISLIFLRGQIEFMRERGFAISAISSPGRGLELLDESERLEVYTVEMPRRITPFQDLKAILRLRRLIRQIDPHIVHSHTPKGGLLGTLSATLAGAPVRIYHMRGLPVETATGLKRFLLSLAEKVSCRLADQVISVSPSLQDVAVHRLKLCPPGKIKVLARGSGNGVDANGKFNPGRVGEDARREVRARHGIPPDATVIGFVGRVTKEKGIVELADAFRRLADEFPGLHLLLVGPFEDQDPVPDDVKAYLETDPRIHLTGMVTDSPPHYAAMDVAVLPTYREGFPNTLLEAAAMGLPVVATRVTGCVDVVVDGVTGSLVAVRDAEALAAGLRRYVTDPALREAHGRAAREHVLANFLPDAIRQALYHEYLRLLRVKGIAGPVPNPASRESHPAAPGT